MRTGSVTTRSGMNRYLIATSSLVGGVLAALIGSSAAAQAGPDPTPVQHWDGSDTTGTVNTANGNGGTGTWTPTSANWVTGPDWASEGVFQGGTAVFATTGGTVTIANGPVSAGRISVQAPNYIFSGDAIQNASSTAPLVLTGTNEAIFLNRLVSSSGVVLSGTASRATLAGVVDGNVTSELPQFVLGVGNSNLGGRPGVINGNVTLAGTNTLMMLSTSSVTGVVNLAGGLNSLLTVGANLPVPQLPGSPSYIPQPTAVSIGGVAGNGSLFVGNAALTIGIGNISSEFNGRWQTVGTVRKVGTGTLTMGAGAVSGGLGQLFIEQGRFVVQHSSGTGPVFSLGAVTIGGGILEIRSPTNIFQIGGTGNVEVIDSILTINGMAEPNRFVSPSFSGSGTVRFVQLGYNLNTASTVRRLEIGLETLISPQVNITAPVTADVFFVNSGGIAFNSSTMTANVQLRGPNGSVIPNYSFLNTGTINGNVDSNGLFINGGTINGNVRHSYVTENVSSMTLQSTSVINGNLTVERALTTVAGTVNGDLILNGGRIGVTATRTFNVSGAVRLEGGLFSAITGSIITTGISGTGGLNSNGFFLLNGATDSVVTGPLTFLVPNGVTRSLEKRGGGRLTVTALRVRDLLVTGGEVQISLGAFPAPFAANFDFDFFTNNARLVSLGTARGIAGINTSWFAHRGLTVELLDNQSSGQVEGFGATNIGQLINSGSVGHSGGLVADRVTNTGWIGALGLVPGTVVRFGRADGPAPRFGSSPVAVVNNGYMGFTNVDVRIENGLTGAGHIELNNANLTIGPYGSGWGGATPLVYSGWISGTGNLATLAPIRFTNRISVSGTMDLTSVTVSGSAGVLDSSQITLRGASNNLGTLGRLDGTVLNLGTFTNFGILRGTVTNRGVLDMANIILGDFINESGGTMQISFDSEVRGITTLASGSTLLMRTGLLLTRGLNGAGILDSGSGPATLTLGAVGGSFTGTVRGTGTIVSTGAGVQSFAASGLTEFGGRLDVPTGTLILTGTGGSSQNARATISAGATLQLDQTTWQVASLGGTGTVNLNGATSGLSIGLGNTSSRFDGLIQGTGRLTKVGTGVLTLGAANSFTGGLAIAGGVIELTTAQAASTGAVVMSAGAVLRPLVPMTFANSISLPGGMGAAVDTGASAVTLSGALSGGRLVKLGSGTLTLSGPLSFTGGVEVAEGTLIGNVSALPGDASIFGTLVLEQPNDAISVRQIIGTGALVKSGAGRLIYGGISNNFTGTTLVSGGTLELNGQLGQSAITVASGATLSGNGYSGGLTAQSGATVSPGAGNLGVLYVLGNATLAAGSTFVADVQVSGPGGTPAPAADGLVVSGTAELTGAIRVNLFGAPGSFEQRLMVVQALGGRTGTFSGLTVNGTLPPAINARMVYDATSAMVEFAPAQLATVLSGEGLSANQSALVTGLDAATAGGATPSRLFALYTLQPGEIAGAVRLMSGEAYASTAQIAMVDGTLASDMALDRSRLLSDTAFFGGRGSGLAGDVGPGTGRGSMAWVQVAGTSATAGSDGNASGFERSASLVALGLDLADPSGTGNWRFGVMAARSVSDFEMAGVGSRGRLTSVGGGVYAGWNGPLGALRLGINHAVLDGQMTRSFEIAGFRTGARGVFAGSSTSTYVEFARPFGGPGGMLLEPYSNVSFSQVSLQGLAETGGPVALAVDDSTQQLGFATVGLRAGRMVSVPGGGLVSLTGGVGMRVLLEGGTQSVRTGLADLPTGTNPVSAAMLSDREFLVEGTISFRLTSQLDASIGYTGAFDGTVEEHGARAALRWSF